MRDLGIYSYEPTLLVKELARQICEQMQDYHNYDDFQFTEDHVIRWVEQFDADDQRFLLQEFLHLLKQGIYVSEELGKDLLVSRIRELAKAAKFGSVSDFLAHVEFLNLQPAGKSQSVLLDMMNELLVEKCGFGIADCGKKSKKFALYIDDILATGSTVIKYLKPWLLQKNDSANTNVDDVLNKRKFIIVSVFCLHTWPDVGYLLKIQLKKELSNKIVYRYDYAIENHPTKLNQRFNFAYPVENQPDEVLQWLDRLPEGYVYNMTRREFALRKANKPAKETLFSSEKNRERFENIILLKGIEILKKVGNLKENQRPLGNINPSFQTLGTGTLFFTWMNISNTTPVVFWWDKHGTNWHSLFPVKNRGN